MKSYKTHRKVTIIAEAGVNHNGSIQLAQDMVDVAAEAGADIIKFQTFKAKNVISRHAPKANYQIRTGKIQETQLEMALKLELSRKSYMRLKERCDKRGIKFLASPFDLDSLQFLVNDIKTDTIKIASGEITNFPLLLAIARSKKYIILSSGMATLSEIKSALCVLAYGYTYPNETPLTLNMIKSALSLHNGGKAIQKYVTILHCTTEYPAEFEEINLKAMDTLRQKFKLPVGLSDHSQGIAIPIAAVARGASVIEKHFTLNKNFDGPDHAASLNPTQLAEMIISIRAVELAVGSGVKCPTNSEKKNLLIVRRSLTASRGISKGEMFTTENLTTKRPGTGISAIHYWSYLGIISSRDYLEDELI